MGEGYGRWRLGDDAQLIGAVSSANVACGFHAGDPLTIDRTVALAAAAGVAVGAHVAYPDLVGFGRRHLSVTGDELTADVLFQIGGLDAICRRHEIAVSYVKAHGALYNDLADDVDLCAAFAAALRAWGTPLPVLALAGSPAVDVLRGLGVRVVAEAFPDRAYTSAGRLASRRTPGAVLDDAREVARRALALARGEAIPALDGAPLRLTADSLCVHGDGPGAVSLARAIHATLAEHGVPVAPFS